MAKSLYICYFGINEPLVQTQVLPYLRELLKDGHKITLLTFEPNNIDRDGVEAARAICGDGIEWHWLRYHKRLSVLATLWDVLCGSWFIRGFIAGEQPDILHARVHVPALMGAIARKLSRHKPKILFDIRGFMPEEYTDAGIWPEGGIVYRLVKRVERWLMKEADGFVVLTEKAREILFPGSRETGRDKLGRPVEVIPCCVDMERFETATVESRNAVRDELGIGTRPVAVYVGAFGGCYLTKETADLFGAMRERDPETFAMILTQSEREMIEPLLITNGFGEADYFIGRVPSSDIPRYLGAADIAVSFIKPCYSKIASSPTKNAEYLACGLPIIANAGVGDVDVLIVENGVGAMVKKFSTDDYLEALSQVDRLSDISDKCRETARREFDLETIGGSRYRKLYASLLQSEDQV